MGGGGESRKEFAPRLLCMPIIIGRLIMRVNIVRGHDGVEKNKGARKTRTRVVEETKIKMLVEVLRSPEVLFGLS